MGTQSVAPPSDSLLRPFYPALDGLRAVAFLMVFLCHYATGLFAIPFLSRAFDWGWAGVDLFFVLSGFLITGILFDSLSNEHFFRTFYLRRILRIFPLYYGIWIGLLLLTPVLHIAWNRYNVAMAAYVGNFFMAGANLHLHAQPGVIFLGARHAGGPLRPLAFGHLWSLCVEEQFYMVWPLVVYLVRSRRALLRISLATVAIVPFLRMAYAHLFPAQVTAGALSIETIFRIDTLLAGAAIALWLRGTATPILTIRRAASTTAIAAPVLLAACYLLFGRHSGLASSSFFVGTVGYTFIAITAGAILLLAIDPQSAVERVLRFKPLLFLGRISYGLYIFHLIAINLAARVFVGLTPYHMQFLVPPAILATTVGVAWLSFRFFESPFLRLKSVLAPQARTQLAPVAAKSADETEEQ